MNKTSLFKCIVAMGVLLGTTAAANAQTTGGWCGDNATWLYNTTTKVLTISGTGDMTNYSGTNTPWDSYRTQITSVSIASGVTSIGNYAFYGCTSLASVTIPSSVTTIGEWAFSSCANLASVTIPSSVTTIGERAFYGCWSLASVTIPSSVTTIGSGAFSDCRSLASVTIPSSVTSIGSNAFSNTSLTEINVNAANANYASADGVLFNNTKTTLMQYPASKQGAAYTIPSSVTTIGSSAFAVCTSLASVNIPSSVTTIGSDAFYDCRSLTEINVNAANANYASANGVLFNKTKTTLIQYPEGKQGAYTIPSSVTTIDYAAFRECRSLASVTIPSSVTTIGSMAFFSCTSLASVSIPSSVTTIGWYAFSNCTTLASVSIPSSVTTIGSYAFSNTSLAKVINESTTPLSISSSTFSSASTTDLYVPADALSAYQAADYWKDFSRILAIGTTPAPITWDCGYCGTSSSCIPTNAVTATLAGDGTMTISGTGAMANYDYNTLPWYSYRTRITSVIVEQGVTTIGQSAFSSCTSLASVTIPSSVTTIGESAFYFCTSLASVTIPSSVTSIGYYAFSSCTSLTEINVNAANANYASENGVLFNKTKTTLIQYPAGKQGTYTIPSSVTTIGVQAFRSCSSLASVNIPSSVTTIGQSAFSSCTSLASVSIPSSVTTIGSNAFAGCTSLASVTIPSSVTSIGSYAFQSCTRLASVTIESGVTTIGYSAFYSCTSLASVTIPSSVTTIGSQAFYYCRNLASVSIPSSITTIGLYAFYGCSNLTSIYANRSTPPSLEGSGVFTNVNTTICTLYVPADAKADYEAATQWQDFTNIVQGYTVTFNSQGGTPVNAQDNMSSGAKATAPSAPTRTDYIFGGWYKEASCTNAWDFNADLVTEDVTLYAKWDVAVTDVTLNKTATTLTVGANETLTATIAPSNATNKAVTWSSSNTAVATVSSTGEVTAVSAGTADITVTTADGGKTASCVVTVTAASALSNNANLGSLSISGYSISPAFGVNIINYTLTVPNNVSTITISATAADSKASVIGAGVKPIDVGSNEFAIVVTAEDDTQKIYTITVTRLAANNNGGNGGNGGNTDNAATPSITAQPQDKAVNVGGSAPLSVTANVTDGGTLSYQWYSNTTNSNNGGTAVGTNSNSYLAPTTTVGTFYYYVVVTNTNNGVNGTKTVTVTSNVVAVVTAVALSNNANLSNFSITGYNISLAFGVYALTVPNKVSTITINATAADSKAQVIGAGTKSIVVGSNEFAIVVTAEDGTQKTYTIIVTRSVVTAVETQSVEPLQIYPNPTSDQLTITSDQWNAVGAGSARPSIEIYNVNGTKVFETSIVHYPLSIDISHLPAGIYLVKVGNRVAKVVKQ